MFGIPGYIEGKEYKSSFGTKNILICVGLGLGIAGMLAIVMLASQSLFTQF